MPKLGVVGTGLMGRPMTERLLDSGYRVSVFNRTRRRAAPFAALGADVVDDPMEVVARSDLTLLMLSDGRAIRETLRTDDLPGDLRERVVCQMSTIGADESRGLRDQIERAGGSYFEAPVLGSRPQARTGRLLVMVGAEPDQFQRWRAVLETLGENPLLVGAVGQAAALKLAFNQLIAAQLTGFATALGMVRRSGVEIETFMQLLHRSALHASTFDAKLPRLLERDFADPNFPVRLLLKDLELARSEAAARGLRTEALEGLCRVVRRAQAEGLGDQDYSAIAAVIDPQRD